MSLRLGIVVGEVSGDNLAADLVLALRKRYPNMIIEGILGPKVIQAGGKALYSMERLSVMGLMEPLARLPDLIKIHYHVANHFIKNPPDLFLGVDAPDFNLRLEKKLKKAGIPVVHYVSPSVWAWRASRIHLIKKAVDLMLTLFPFEKKIYEDHHIPVQCVGHPLADQIPLQTDKALARKHLAVQAKQVIALLPGSRLNELKKLGSLFLQTAQYCAKALDSVEFIIPAVSETHQNFLQSLCQEVAPELSLRIIRGVEQALMAADAVLVTSGTATLETLLYKKPMVVAYRMNAMTYWIAKRIVKIPYIALPNLLAGRKIVPEFIQEECSPSALGNALLEQLSHHPELIKTFETLHQSLRKNSSEQAAQAIHHLIEKRGILSEPPNAAS